MSSTIVKWTRVLMLPLIFFLIGVHFARTQIFMSGHIPAEWELRRSGYAIVGVGICYAFLHWVGQRERRDEGA